MRKRRRDHRAGRKQFILTLVFCVAIAAVLSVFSSGQGSEAGTSQVQQNGFIDILPPDILPPDIIGDILPTTTTTLAMTTSGDGAGTVTSTNPTQAPDDGNALSCARSLSGTQSGDCSDDYTFLASSLGPITVNLFAVPAPGSDFVGFSGSSGCSSGSVNLITSKSCIATFTTNYVNVTLGGTGTGTVTGPNISCPPDCTGNYSDGTSVLLTAAPGVNSTFTGSWGGACASFGINLQCSLIVNSDLSVSATFNGASQPLTVTLGGTGGGTVTSDPAAISCTWSGGVQSGTCAANRPQGSSIMLTAQPAAGSTFTGSWGGACAAFGTNPTCTLTMTTAQNVTATFTLAGGGGGGGGGSGACTITGNNLANVLNGTAGDDVICAKGGNDVVDGKGGNDIVRAGKGADVVKGGKGNDTLFGEKGADVLTGGKGTDTASGGPGIDVCSAEVKISCP